MNKIESNSKEKEEAINRAIKALVLNFRWIGRDEAAIRARIDFEEKEFFSINVIGYKKDGDYDIPRRLNFRRDD